MGLLEELTSSESIQTACFRQAGMKVHWVTQSTWWDKKGKSQRNTQGREGSQDTGENNHGGADITVEGKTRDSTEVNKHE